VLIRNLLNYLRATIYAISYFENFYEIIIILLLQKFFNYKVNRIRIILRNKKSFDYDPVSLRDLLVALSKFRDRIKLKILLNNIIVDVCGYKFIRYYHPLGEVFINEVYNINVYDRDVVDIGAFVGDSSIYFCAKGARRCIAVEPQPRAFKELLINIKLNLFSTKIIPVNAYILTSSNDFIYTPHSIISPTHSANKEFVNDNIVPVQVTNLQNLINNYKINKHAILKLDCEGCEYELIKYNIELISDTFDQIIFEFHLNKEKLYEIIRLLKNNGYKVDITSSSLIHCYR